MKRTAAIAAAGVFALASVFVINDAQTQGCRECGIGLGILGGLAAGAIIGPTMAPPPPYRPYVRYGRPPPAARLTNGATVKGTQFRIHSPQVGEGDNAVIAQNVDGSGDCDD
jgi:hypothetical protein